MLFEIERAHNGQDAKARLDARRRLSALLVDELVNWLRVAHDGMSKHDPVAKAIAYLLDDKHWPGFTRFLRDGRVCLTNNAAERSLRGVALGRKAWLFARSEGGGDRAAFMYTLIVAAKLNDIDPQALLVDRSSSSRRALASWEFLPRPPKRRPKPPCATTPSPSRSTALSRD